ncbi:unnamed protein product [Rangifer tarandus platyrhynchus]|uniref:Uncharacterized protein n=2 Tax=Rangifer tarandus platyrhynchus TaxID=3082113 RepID=A0ACB0ECR5_RANTA|nr:unnamed protein product [Rangifer tarandus platyrhynchus]CAI9697986.1 unnamed protein product [Rangifer tarandus platyrhynchus]
MKLEAPRRPGLGAPAPSPRTGPPALTGAQGRRRAESRRARGGAVASPHPRLSANGAGGSERGTAGARGGRPAVVPGVRVPGEPPRPGWSACDRGGGGRAAGRGGAGPGAGGWRDARSVPAPGLEPAPPSSPRARAAARCSVGNGWGWPKRAQWSFNVCRVGHGVLRRATERGAERLGLPPPGGSECPDGGSALRPSSPRQRWASGDRTPGSPRSRWPGPFPQSGEVSAAPEMSQLSFRARALDASKPLPVFRCEDLPDLQEYAWIRRAAPQMPTGMEMEEGAPT